MMNIKEQIDSILKDMFDQFCNELKKSKNYGDVKGLWLFRFNEHLNSLEHWSIFSTIISESQSNNFIDSVKIAIGEGSIGHAVLKDEIAVVQNTAEDPRGVISIEDEKIGQKSAICYPIFFEEGSQKKLVCVLDFFGDNFLFKHKKKYKAIINGIVEGTKEKLILLNELFAYSRLQTLLISETDSNIVTASVVNELSDKYINEILPCTFTEFSDDNINAKEISINTQYLVGIIKEEIEWCSYQIFQNKSCNTDCIIASLSLDCPLNPNITGIKITNGYKVIYKLRHSETVNNEIIIRPLKKLIEGVVKLKVISKIKDELVEISINYLLNNNRSRDDSDQFTLLMQSYSLQVESENYTEINKLKFEYVFVYREDDGYVWDPDKNKGILEIKDFKSDFKKLSVIKAIYAGLKTKKNRFLYPVPIKSQYSLDYKNDLIIIKKENFEHTWQWLKGKRNKVIAMYIDNDKLDNFKVLLLKPNLDLTSFIGEKHFIQYIKILNYKFKLACRANPTKTQNDNINTYLNHVCGVYQTNQAKNNVIKHAHKAAMVAIMSRNLSHNIGSHVLSYWNQEIDNDLRGVQKYNKDQTSLKKSKDLFQYIQHRMDFLAAVSTTIPSWEMSLDIRTDIIAPVFTNPNKDKYFTNSGSLTEPSILLSNIAKSEGINLYEEDTDELNKQIKLDTSGMGVNTRVSIPHGYIGNHAIYAILENFIRNAAKHYDGANKGSAPMIKIVVKEPNDKNWEKDYFVMRIWDMRDNSCDTDKVNKLRKYLPGSETYSFTTKEGELESGGWGIKEMLTSANFLRKKKPEFLLTGMPKNEPPLFEILCGYDNENSDGCCKKENEKMNCNRIDDDYKNRLGIRLYLRKPKDLLVTDETLKDTISKKVKFEIKYENLEKEYKDKEVPYRMMLVKTEVEKNKYKKEPIKPCRIMADGNQLRCSQIDDNYYLGLYEQFINTDILEFAKLNLKLSYYNCLTDEKFSSNEYTKTDCISENANSTGNIEYVLVTSQESYLLFVYHLDRIINTNSSLTAILLGDSKIKYLQPVSGGYSTRIKLDVRNHPKDKYLKKHFYLELIESALTKVIIVDERISKWAKSNFARNVLIKDILKNMNIYIVDVNTEAITLDALNSELQAAAKQGFDVFENDINKNAHFFVIHQGILDKIQDAKDFINSKIKCSWKVVDSGRGVPKELEDYINVRFVEISALQTMLEHYDKHALVQTLFSLRAPQSLK